MTVENDGYTTPEQDASIERRVDTQNISYALARAIELGEALDTPVKSTSGDAISESETSSLPGKPLSYPSPGHVRDFQGDRSVALSPGNMIGTEQGLEGFMKVRDELNATSEELFIDRLQQEIADGKLTQTEADARLRAHRERRNLI